MRLASVFVFLALGADAQMQRARFATGYMYSYYVPQSASTPWRPAWSPDGKEIAFMGNAGNPLIASPMGSGIVCSGDIYATTTDGSHIRRLTSTDGLGGDSHPTWSLDGKRIAFVGRDSEGGADIFSMDPDGSNISNLTNSPGQDEDYPEWSPDGSQIAYQAFVNNENWELFVMNADGSKPVQLTSVTNGWNWQPSWSPDGTQIAFTSNRTKFWNIYVTNADGSNVRALTSSAANNYYPDWSPDGTLIAFVSNLDSQVLQLYTIAPDGSGMTLLTSDLQAVDSGEPDWLPLTP
jgi:Tol biopolymer transport system component